MSRRSTPERIDAAREAAARRRLERSGSTEATAAAWVAAWHERAAQDGLERSAAYWEAAWEWISVERVKRVRP